MQISALIDDMPLVARTSKLVATFKELRGFNGVRATYVYIFEYEYQLEGGIFNNPNGRTKYFKLCK